MGGIWEAAVKQAKIFLGKVVGESILTFEEFSTLLTKIEAIMNSRPIAVTQTEDIDCVTPAHFLIGRTFTDIAEENITEQNISPLARWKLVKQMQQHFWNRWHHEYLTTLQKRCKWTSESQNITTDDIVLVAETNLASTCWALGKVVKIYTGNDGKVRIVDIRLANCSKIIQRPIHKLCKLPVQSYESADSWPAEC